MVLEGLMSRVFKRESKIENRKTESKNREFLNLESKINHAQRRRGFEPRRRYKS